MFKKSFLSKKTSIAAIVIVASVMAGCQKEMEDDEVSIIFLDSYKPIRLKSGGENPGGSKTLIETYYVGPNYSNSHLISLPFNAPSGKPAYQLQIRPPGTTTMAGTDVKITLGPNNSKTIHHHGNDLVPKCQNLFSGGGSGNGSFAITHTWGGPAMIEIYRYNY